MKIQLRKLVVVALLMLIGTAWGYAQGTITGKVQDETTGEALIGAAVKIAGTTKGAITDENGVFELKADAGTVKLEISYIGYESKTLNATVKDGKTTKMGKIFLKSSSFGLGGVNIIADRAKERETPVAFSDVKQKQLQLQLGSQDLPMVMNNTPSVYATAQGGGAGDARINVRGFNQRNVAIMINGVPVNDMENGWVYWSNWDGIADATSSIQMQRGLSAVNLATPSIGGTMNIITSPADNVAGVSGKFEVGSGSFFKSTITAHSGLINGKWAVSGSVVRKTGQGVIDKTWTDAWAYYLGASYNINKNHRLEVYLVGAPQRHGQNLYKQNVAAYDSAYAKEIGADSAVAFKFIQRPSGRLFNQNWDQISSTYTGSQFSRGKTHDRHSSDFLNERENFYHKPIANLNWYAQWSDKISQFTTFYYSGGTGGGSGTYGKLFRRDAEGKLGDKDYKFYYGKSPWSWDWNETQAANASALDTIWVDKKPVPRKAGESIGILRNSVNNQWTIGAISKLKINFSDHFKGQVGIDWRKAQIEHYREVRDLLGGEYYVYKGNEFETTDEQYKKKLGDKIAYYNTNTVDWFGFYLQGEYSTKKITAYATYGYSMIKYTFTDHFHKAKDAQGNKLDQERYTEAPWISGSQIKGGLSYRPTANIDVYGNFGLVSKVPIFDNVINDRDGSLASDPANEKFTAFEIGANYKSSNDKFKVNLNYYYTKWTDRAITKGVYNQDGTEGLIFLTGMNQLHKGFEVEAHYRINKLIGLGAIGSFGNWEYTDDVSGEYKDYSGGTDTTIKYDYYVKGLKVGDAPQTQMAFWLDLYPVKGLQFQAIYRYNTNYYADWDPFSRTDPNDKAQVWQVPSYGLLDFHVAYKIPLKGHVGLELFAHMFNSLNTLYISDGVDNSRYNGYYGTKINGVYSLSHTANSAEVFMGLPRTFNAGVKISFR